MLLSSFKNYILAARPKTLTASLCPIIILVALEKKISLHHIYALLCCFCLQIACNYFNDAIDGERGTDKNRQGPTRLTNSGKLKSKNLKIAGLLLLIIGYIIFLQFNILNTIPSHILYLSAALMSYLYTGTQYSLSYNGFGEIFVYIFFGYFSLCGFLYVTEQAINLEHYLASSSIGVSCVFIIMMNNLRDHKTDALSKKNTLCVLVGSNNFKILFYLLCFIFVLQIALIADHFKNFDIWIISSFIVMAIYILIFTKFNQTKINNLLAVSSINHLLQSIILGVYFAFL